MFAFLLLLFGLIDGDVKLAYSRNKVHAKKRKIGFSPNFCSTIYTYSTVYMDSRIHQGGLLSLFKCIYNINAIYNKFITDTIYESIYTELDGIR